MTFVFLVGLLMSVGIELAIVRRSKWLQKAVLSWRWADFGLSILLTATLFGGFAAFSTNAALMVALAGFVGNLITSAIYAIQRKFEFARYIYGQKHNRPVNVLFFDSVHQKLDEDIKSYQRSIQTGERPDYHICKPPSPWLVQTIHKGFGPFSS